MVSARQKGYIALMTVLIIGAAATAIGVALLVIGADSQRTALVQQRSKQARTLAVACVDEALQQINSDISYTGNLIVPLGQGTCTSAVTTTGVSTRNIATTGTVGGVVRKVQVAVTIGATTLSINSWQE